MKKPISPTAHTIFDYMFGLALVVLPPLMDVNKEARSTYRKFAAGFTSFNAATDTSAGIVRVVPFKVHKAGDYANVGLLAAAGLAKPIRDDKRAVAFHVGFLAMAIAHILLTDYNGPTG